jgi:hypothetical protein
MSKYVEFYPVGGDHNILGCRVEGDANFEDPPFDPEPGVFRAACRVMVSISEGDGDS